MYGCGVVAAEGGKPADWAIVRLDRAVKDRPALAVNTGAGVKKDDEIFMIGHPMGLPAKVAGGEKVLAVDKTAFHSHLDAYSGNSGSPVFNSKTNLIEGVLYRGAPDASRKALEAREKLGAGGRKLRAPRPGGVAAGWGPASAEEPGDVPDVEGAPVSP